MSPKRLGLLCICILLLLPSVGLAEFRRSEQPVPNRYIIRLPDAITTPVPGVAAELAQQHGAKIVHLYQHTIKGFAAQMPEAAAIAMSLNPLVVSVTEDTDPALGVSVSGTSVASPLVAGAAARALQINNAWTPAEVEAFIKNDATLNRISDTEGSPNLLLYVEPPPQ